MDRPQGSPRPPPLSGRLPGGVSHRWLLGHGRNYLDKWTRPAVVADEGSPYEYYCRMHPTVVLSHPGICPVAGCGMPLIQRRKGGKIILPEDVLVRVQLTPSRICAGQYRDIACGRGAAGGREIRTVGMLDYDETRVAATFPRALPDGPMSSSLSRTARP